MVDDSIPSLRMLTEILTKEGYKVRPVEDPQSALEAAMARSPQSLILCWMSDAQDERLRTLPAFETG